MNTEHSNLGIENARTGRPVQSLPPHSELQPVDDLIDYATEYARENPGTAALWCFGIGFVLGWKLKPW